MIDIPKLISELETVSEPYAADAVSKSLMRDLCRRAAMALKDQRQSSAQEIMHRLGLLLIELGKKLTGQSDG